MKKQKWIAAIWWISAILEWANIILFMAALGRVAFTFEWYTTLLMWPYTVIAFYICSTVLLILFYFLVMYNHKKENYKDMMIAFVCFITQMALLIWKIKI